MKQAIERVIDELDKAIVPGEEQTLDLWDHGWNMALARSKDLLKAVLAEHENDNGAVQRYEQSHDKNQSE